MSFLRNRCLTQGHKDLLLFSCKSFLVLAFTVRSVIHLESTSVYVCVGGGHLRVFTCGPPAGSASLAEKTVSPLKCLGILYHPFLLSFLEKYLFLLFSVKHRFTKIIKILIRVTLCWFVHSPAGLAIPVRGPVKGFTPAHSTWYRPTITRYARHFRRKMCSLFLGMFGVGRYVVYVCALYLCIYECDLVNRMTRVPSA